MNTLRIFLMAALVLVVLDMGNTEAEKQPEWTFKTENYVDSVAISGSGDYLVSGGWDNKVYLFSDDSTTPIWNYSTGDDVISVAISDDGEYIVAGSQGSKIYLFNRNSSTPLWNYTYGNSPVASVDISADGQYIIAGYENPGRVFCFHKNSSTPIWNYDTYMGRSVKDVAISNDGYYVAVASGFQHGSQISFLSGSGTYLWALDNRNSDGNIEFDLAYVAISADGEYTVAGTRNYNDDKDQFVYLFGKHNNTPIWSYNTHTGTQGSQGVRSVAISADGEHVIVSANKLYLFNNNNNTPIWTNSAGQGAKETAISTDGNYIATANDNRVSLFQRENGLMLWACTASSYTVGISADGEHIVNGGYHNNVNLFNKTTAPEAEFNWSSLSDATVPKDSDLIPYHAVEGLPVYFDAGLSTGHNLTYHWDFTGDASYIGQLILHTFEAAQQYNVTLTVTDLFGVENKTTRSISVNIDETRNDEEEEKEEEENTNTEESSETPCQTGETKIADDGCNQCVCDDGDWLCTEMACENPEEKESLLSSISLISALISIGLITIYRRK